MINRKHIYEKVEKKIYQMKKKAQDDLEFRREIFYKRAPQAREIERILGATSINVARAVIKGANVTEEIKKIKETNIRLQSTLESLLKEFNLPPNYLQIEYNCEICKDEGFVNGIMCRCMKDMIKKESYNELNKLSPLSLSTFETFSLDYYSKVADKENEQSPYERMSIIYRYCLNYANKFNEKSKSIIMRGGTGLGKTHLSLAIANSVIEDGYGVIYISAPNMVSRLEKERFGDIETFSGSESYFINCDLLIVDDLGTEFSTQFSNAVIYNIINSRILMSKPTIISTNLTLKELEKNYTERMVSRIIGENVRLEFLGEDIRQKKRLRK